MGLTNLLFVFVLLAANVVDAQASDGSWTAPAYCTDSAGGISIVSLIASATESSFNGQAFCSQLLAPKVYSTTVLATISTTLTNNVFYEVTTTVTDRATPTLTELCPTPSASQQCGISGNGYSTYLISENESLTEIECHQLCLTTKSCKSFQYVSVNGEQLCNLYNAKTATAIDAITESGILFYDRDCPNLLPAGCAASVKVAERAVVKREAAPEPVITPAPRALPAANHLEVRDFSTTFAYPAFLDLGEEDLAIYCSCVVTAVNGTVSVLLPTTSDYVSILTTTSTTYYDVITKHKYFTTIYTSVAS